MYGRREQRQVLQRAIGTTRPVLRRDRYGINELFSIYQVYSLGGGEI